MKTRATYQETLEIGPLPCDCGQEILRYLRGAFQWMPRLPVDVRLEELRLVFSRKSGTVNIESPGEPLVSRISGGENMFGTEYRLELQGLPIAKDTAPAQTVGQLTVRDSDGLLLLALPLSLYRYCCMRALVEASINAKGILHEKADLELVSLTDAEFEKVLITYGDEYERIDVGERDPKAIADYIRFMDAAIRKAGLPSLVVGTLKYGLSLDTHPSNIRFIVAPQNPFHTGSSREGASEEVRSPLVDTMREV